MKGKEHPQKGRLKSHRSWVFRSLFLTLILALLSGCGFIDWVGGNFHDEPTRPLSAGAEKLRQQAFAGFDEKTKFHDVHIHVVGLGNGLCAAYVNLKKLRWSWTAPFERLEGLVYLSASGVKNEDNADEEYTERLLSLINAMPEGGKYHIVGLDWNYGRKDGQRDQFDRRPEASTFYMSNDCIVKLWEKHRNLFVPVVSVHPYKEGALAELKHWAAKGVRYVKWLPNAQGMDPGDPDIDPYYRTMIRHNMILLSHVGEEKAVEADEDQALGNPLCFRRPLDMGLKIIMAHSGSLGTNKDLDKGGDAPKVSNFQLFIRLMEDEKYIGNLFGEISAMTQYNRLERDEDAKEDRFRPPPLVALLKDDKLRALLETRFVNGSDYPLPAINFVIRTKKLVALKLITEQQRVYLNEIYRRNPLEFDFVLKRTLRLPGTGTRLPHELFSLPSALEVEATYPQSVVDNLDNTSARAALSKIRCR